MFHTRLKIWLWSYFIYWLVWWHGVRACQVRVYRRVYREYSRAPRPGGAGAGGCGLLASLPAAAPRGCSS